MALDGGIFYSTSAVIIRHLLEVLLQKLIRKEWKEQGSGYAMVISNKLFHFEFQWPFSTSAKYEADKGLKLLHETFVDMLNI
jgi:hypothetical protein